MWISSVFKKNESIVSKLSCNSLNSEIQLESLVFLEYWGGYNFSLGVTGANVDSSRSHAILQIVLKGPNAKLHGMKEKENLMNNFEFR